MQSQRLVIDTIKRWSSDRLHIKADVTSHDLDYARLWLISSEPEYIGTPDFEVIVLWEREFAIDEHPEWHELVHQLVRSFEHETKIKCKDIVHKGLTTYVHYKTTEESKNCENFNWIDVIAPKPDVI